MFLRESKVVNLKSPDLIISSYLFNDFESKPIVLIDISFCNENQKVSNQLFKKLKTSTKEKYDFVNALKAKKVRQLSPLKKKNRYPCKVYEGVCSCKENYIGESKRNSITHWNEHENSNKDSEPAKDLFQYPDHIF